MTLKSNPMEWLAVPLRVEQLPSHLRDRDPSEGDANGPFLVMNDTGDVLDRRNYCQWRAPRLGDGYSDFSRDCK